MPKHSFSKTASPPEVTRALEGLGTGLKVARLRRGESQAAFSERLMVARYTLQRMEKGDPGVALGAWINAAWLLGRLDAFLKVFNPDFDETGKRLERRWLPKRAGTRQETSRSLDNDF